ncbi:MAG: RagB/SusD family nutrient uptake outer membrane protein [Candidatus Cyclobacteriaceae bacterium M3_2C_046]
MKNIKIKLFIIVFSLAGYSCSDFLEEQPRDEISTGQFFTEPTHAYNAVNTLYANGVAALYRGGIYSGTETMLGQYMSGFFDNEYKGQEPHVQNAQQLTLNGNNLDDYLNGIWSGLYQGIARANNAIKYIPETPGLTNGERAMLEAEAKFFRGFAYYFLVRMFGEVPTIVEPYESLDDIYVERNSVAEVYDLIISDLTFAINQGNLSENSMVNNGYRITKGAAQTILSEVYLTMSGFPLQDDHYAEAASLAKAVINSGTYELMQHTLDSEGALIYNNSAYNKIRKEEALAKEYIYLIEHEVGIWTNNYPGYCYPVALANEVKYAITNGAYQPVEEFLWGYDPEKDLRIQNKQYFHTTFEDENGEIITFPPTPYIWHDTQALFETATSGKDILAYGYADVLLIAAEAIARSEGVTSEAVNYLAEVKSRAFWKMEKSDLVDELSSLSVDEFVNEVWEERYRELVFTFKTWFDIIRTRKFPQTNENGKGSINFVDFVGQQNSWGQTFQERHLLFPLPERELQRNPALTQNEGY